MCDCDERFSTHMINLGGKKRFELGSRASGLIPKIELPHVGRRQALDGSHAGNLTENGNNQIPQATESIQTTD